MVLIVTHGQFSSILSDLGLQLEHLINLDVVPS